MTMLEHPPWDVEHETDLFDEPVPLDELELDASGPELRWPGRPPRAPHRLPASPPARRRRRGALLAALALVGGGVAGGVVARMTTRPPAVTTVAVAATTSVTGGTGAFDVPGVIERVGRSVVSIDVSATATGPWGNRYLDEAAGTGFVLSAAGLIATNQHVIEGADTISVTMSDGTKYDATVVGASTGKDLAVLHIDTTGLVPLSFGSSSSLRVGTSVVAVGNALALEGGLTASLGIISAKGRSITVASDSTYTNLLQTDAAINAGDSGGPLVDRDGLVVGINTAGTTQAENIGFAIPIDDAGPVLMALAAGRSSDA